MAELTSNDCKLKSFGDVTNSIRESLDLESLVLIEALKVIWEQPQGIS